MHQRVPADKCSCGLTRGKIRGLRTPESSQSAMDLLIPSLDKECENNDALSASAARVLGNLGLESAAGGGVQDRARCGKVDLCTPDTSTSLAWDAADTEHVARGPLHSNRLTLGECAAQGKVK